LGNTRNALYEAVFEALPCEIVVHDGDTIVLANAAACHAFGAMSPRGLIGLPLTALITPVNEDSPEDRRALRNGQSGTYEPLTVRVADLGGDTVTLDVNVRGFTVGGRDYAVVVRRRYRPDYLAPDSDTPEYPGGTPLELATLDSMLQPVTVYDSDDHFLFSNAAAQRVFVGAPEPRLAGHPVTSVIHPIAHEAARERRRHVLDAGQSFPHIEVKLRRLDGTALHAIGSLGSARLPGGTRVGYWMAHAVRDGQLSEILGSA